MLIQKLRNTYWNRGPTHTVRFPKSLTDKVERFGSKFELSGQSRRRRGFASQNLEIRYKDPTME
jgi:hypothetical protein